MALAAPKVHFFIFHFVHWTMQRYVEVAVQQKKWDILQRFVMNGAGNAIFLLSLQSNLIKFRNMKKILLAVLTVLGFNTACSQGNYDNRRTQQEQNGARSSYAMQGGERQYVNADVNEFAELIADTNVVVLDVRTASEFAEGHLERAINIDYHQSNFVEKAQATLPQDKKIAVYCRSGRRSAGAAGKLGDVGYQLVNLKGGIIAWKEANMPVIKE